MKTIVTARSTIDKTASDPLEDEEPSGSDSSSLRTYVILLYNL
jgi:hypothetical protein